MKKMKDFFDDKAVEYDDLFIKEMEMIEFYDEVERSCKYKKCMI